MYFRSSKEPHPIRHATILILSMGPFLIDLQPLMTIIASSIFLRSASETWGNESSTLLPWNLAAPSALIYRGARNLSSKKKAQILESLLKDSNLDYIFAGCRLLISFVLTTTSSMALLSSIFGCFSDSSRVASEGEIKNTQNRSPSIAGADVDSKSKLNKSKSKKSPPIPVTYFPIGSRLSPLWES